MILDSINSNADLKGLSQGELAQLCEEIREVIIETVSRNGGHLAPSLGTVELATALHHVFDSPRDKIIWDVGHQAYAHKLLTGRRDSFHTLRKMGGISGFPKMSESPHDAFGAGHGSTSISAALGMAQVMDKRGEQHRAIAVIGDGSMTGGLAFEALNHAGHKAGNLIVVLNDNEMSIAPSVGALSRFLSIRIHGSLGNRIRQSLKKLLHLIPWLGERVFRVAQKAEEATVGFLTPGFLFEAFGFDYIGPLDGHDMATLVEVFTDIKASPVHHKPILIHVSTKKGKGYPHAESNPTKYHGIGPFDRETGETLGLKKRSYTDAFGDAMLDLAARDPRVLAITAAMADGTGLRSFARQCADRFFDVGMAEGHAVTFAAGLASQGYRPVVAIYSTFLQRSYDQIIHDVCLQNLPVTFALDRAGLVGDDGPTHHGTFDISFLRSIPNLNVCAPRDGRMMKEMLKFAVQCDGPLAMRYPRGSVPEDVIAERPRDLAKASAETVYWRDNPNALIWAVGNTVVDAIAAAKKLRAEGIDIAVIDARFIKPFDHELFAETARQCANVITVEENVLAGGFGSMVAEHIQRERMTDIHLTCLGIPDRFIEQGPPAALKARCGIDADGIAEAVRNLLTAGVSDRQDVTDAARETPRADVLHLNRIVNNIE